METRGITLWPLIAATYFMASGGPYGLEEAVSSAGYAGAILLVLITPIIWSLPTGLMVAELSSAIPADARTATAPTESVIRQPPTDVWRNYVTVPDGPCGYPMGVQADCYNGCGCVSLFCGCAEIRRMTKVADGKMIVKSSRGGRRTRDLHPIRIAICRPVMPATRTRCPVQARAITIYRPGRRKERR